MLLSLSFSKAFKNTVLQTEATPRLVVCGFFVVVVVLFWVFLMSLVQAHLQSQLWFFCIIIQRDQYSCSFGMHSNQFIIVSYS